MAAGFQSRHCGTKRTRGVTAIAITAEMSAGDLLCHGILKLQERIEHLFEEQYTLEEQSCA